MESMLWQFRAAATARSLWVDAISLNQADNDEKSEQVGLMGEICTEARKVRI